MALKLISSATGRVLIKHSIKLMVTPLVVHLRKNSVRHEQNTYAEKKASHKSEHKFLLLVANLMPVLCDRAYMKFWLTVGKRASCQ